MHKLQTKLKLFKLTVNKLFDIKSCKWKNFKACTRVLENEVPKEKQLFLSEKRKNKNDNWSK